MEKLETPYEVETEFIECTVCEKSLRGDTLYKIHLTTPAHIKKEDALVAAGRAVRKHTVPEFKDIVHYLDYLKLDEPIIGLSFLDELPSNDLQTGPRYLCRLCHHTANLAEMVHHVIGRKHRQKYVELKRQDLVTWDKESIITQGGKIIRARAEIIERQDGRGSPVALVRRGVEGRLNICRVPPRERQNKSRGQRSTEHNVPPLLPELKGYSNEYSSRVKYGTDYQKTLQFHPEEPKPNRDRNILQRDDTLGLNYLAETIRRERDMYREKYMDPDNRRVYEDPQNLSPPRVDLEPSGFSRYNSRQERPHGQTQHVNYYPDIGPPNRRPFPENDPLKEFYTEEVRRRRGQSADYQPPQRAYQGERQWSLEREPGRHDSMIRAGRQGSSEPEAKRGGFRDYRQNEIMSYSGPSTSQIQVDVTRTMCNIPEPFRRFLKGDTNDESSKRKRKSRFSDATAEEVEMTKEMFSDEYGPPDPKFGGCPRGAGVSLRSEILGTHLDHYTESQMDPHHESYQEGALGTGDVFDMLKSIEIETTEDADFLKNKLCRLLNEFKSRKSEKNMHNNLGRAVNNNYSSLRADLHLSPGYEYETAHREDSDIRRPDIYFEEDHRGIGKKEHDNRFIDYNHLGHGEPRYSNRSHHQDEPPYPEPMYPPDYQRATEDDFDAHSAASSLHMEQKPRMDRGFRYSNNIDKITSTLLEFVARK